VLLNRSPVLLMAKRRKSNGSNPLASVAHFSVCEQHWRRLSHTGIALILTTLWAGGVLAGQATGRFEKAFCTFKLPNSAWDWTDASAVPNGVFAAANDEEGLRLGLVAQPCPEEEAEVSRRSIPRFEKVFLKKGVVKKVGGKLMTFRGVPCYQLQLQVLPDEGTAVARVFIAHGLAYQFQLRGGTEPVWERPDLESIFGGFKFISAPEPPPNRPRRPLRPRRASSAGPRG